MDALFPSLRAALGLPDDEMPAPFAPGPLTGVLFAEDFDGPVVVEAAAEPELAPPPEPEVVAPSFTEEDLDAARREGHAAGMRAAAEEAARTQEAARVAALQQIAAGFATAQAAAASVVETAVEGTAGLILQMIARMLPALSAAHGEAEIRMLVRTLMPALAREPRATIHVNPAHQAAIAAEIEALDPAAAERLVLQPAPAMPAGDARITWEAGVAKREAAAIQSAIEQALSGLGLLAPRMTKHTQPGKQDAGRELGHVG
jgi:flagellar assembly protein FliH